MKTKPQILKTVIHWKPVGGPCWVDLWFGHWPSDCAVTIAEEHFILKLFMILKNFGSVLLFLFKSKPLCYVAKDQAVLSLINPPKKYNRHVTFRQHGLASQNPKGGDILSVGQTTDCSVGSL